VSFWVFRVEGFWGVPPPPPPPPGGGGRRPGWGGVAVWRRLLFRERIFIELMPSDRKLKASRDLCRQTVNLRRPERARILFRPERARNLFPTDDAQRAVDLLDLSLQPDPTQCNIEFLLS